MVLMRAAIYSRSPTNVALVTCRLTLYLAFFSVASLATVDAANPTAVQNSPLAAILSQIYGTNLYSCLTCDGCIIGTASGSTSDYITQVSAQVTPVGYRLAVRIRQVWLEQTEPVTHIQSHFFDCK